MAPEFARVVADAVSQLGGAAVGDIDRIGVDRALEQVGADPEVGDVDGGKLGPGDADGSLDGACAVQGQYTRVRQTGRDAARGVAAIVADSISQLGGAAVEDMDRIGVDIALEEVGADPEFGDVDGAKLGAGDADGPLDGACAVQGQDPAQAGDGSEQCRRYCSSRRLPAGGAALAILIALA